MTYISLYCLFETSLSLAASVPATKSNTSEQYSCLAGCLRGPSTSHRKGRTMMLNTS